MATVPLPGVSGRIDHLAFDPATRRLFVARARKQHGRGHRYRRQSPRALPVRVPRAPGHRGRASDLKAVAIANGATGTLQLVEADSLKTRWTAAVGEDADNVRYDAAQKQLFVAADGLAVVDPSIGPGGGAGSTSAATRSRSSSSRSRRACSPTCRQRGR